MTKQQIFRALRRSNIPALSQKSQAMLGAFFEEMRNKQYGTEETTDAFVWFESGWDAAAAKVTESIK